MTSLFSSIDFNSPLSLYSIPVIWFTGFYPNTLKVSLDMVSMSFSDINLAAQFLKIDNSVGYNKYAFLFAYN